MEIFGTFIDTTTFVLLLVALVSMLYFANKEYRNRQAGGHADYKALIVSIGVLGTFIGIFIGLWQFDTANIANSVPALLEGLKLAFATSILGMLVSVVLAGLESAKYASFADEAATLASISGKLDAVPAIVAATNGTVEQLENFRMEVRDEQIKSRKFIQEQFVQTNKALDIAIKTLAEGATAQIIKALEGVINDFNNNLTKQFGDNFKQLNAAVHKLVEWQENYRRQVEHSTRMLEYSTGTLRAISDSLNNSDKTLAEISRRNNEMIDIQKLVHATLKKQGEQLKMSGALITDQERLTKNLDSMMRDYEAVIKKTGQGIEKLTDSINKSVSAQSQSLKSLADNIEKQLPRTLAELDSNLAGLTRRFATDYQSFLNRYQALVGGAARD